MAWIKSHSNLARRPETIALALALDIEVDAAVGKLLRLFWWVMEFSPDGRLEQFSDMVIADVLGVPTDEADEFMQILIGTGWLTSEPDSLVVTDWHLFKGRQ